MQDYGKMGKKRISAGFLHYKNESVGDTIARDSYRNSDLVTSTTISFNNQSSF